MLKVYTIFDKKVASYGKPIFANHVQEVLRDLSQLVNSENQNHISNFPEDFCLYRIGEYDQATAGFETHNPVPEMELAALVQSRPGPEMAEQLSVLNREAKAVAT